MQTTVKELAQKTNTPPVMVNSVLRFLEATGKAREIGKVDPDKKAVGRKAVIFEVDAETVKHFGW
jgi:hypothetical protein